MLGFDYICIAVLFGEINDIRFLNSILHFDQLMHLDVYVRHRKFPPYAVLARKITSTACDCKYIYVKEKYTFYCIIEQKTLVWKFSCRMCEYFYDDVHIRAIAYGSVFEEISTSLSG